MPLIYVVHIVAGSLALLAGYVALYAAKGAALHRKTGMVFVLAMLTMSVAGTTISAIRGVAPSYCRSSSASQKSFRSRSASFLYSRFPCWPCS